jgi:hypothetical protein
MHFLQAINSDLSVLIVCNKTGGTIKKKEMKKFTNSSRCLIMRKHCNSLTPLSEAGANSLRKAGNLCL